MKTVKYLLLLILWVSAFALDAQTNTIHFETPDIIKGTVVNDSYYYGGITIGTTYTGTEPFMDWEHGIFYSLDSGNTWEKAARKELPITDQLDFAANSFPGSGFENDAIQMYRVSPELMEATNRGPVITIPIYVKTEQNAIDFAVFDDGNFAATWRRKNTQGYDNIYCQVFDAQGKKSGDTYLVASQSGQSAYFPKSKITALESGHFIITWENHPMTGNPRSIVQARILRYKNGTIGERSAIALNTFSIRNNLAAAIVKVSGGFIAFTRQWWVESSRYFYSGFYGQQYDMNGNPAGSLMNIASSNSSDAEISNSSPAILLLNDNSRVFIWEERPAQLFVQKLTNDFAQTGSRFKVVDIKAYEWTAAPNTGSSGFFVGWKESSGGNIRGQFYTANGNADGSSILINTKANTEASRPFAGAYHGEGFALSWLQYNHDIQTYQVTIRRYHANKQFQEMEYFPESEARNYVYGNLQGTKCIASYLNAGNNRDCLLFTGTKMLYSTVLNPAKDINIQFKVVDAVTGNQAVSPVRSYLYANPADGLGSTISYMNGFTNHNQAKVAINLTAGRYKSLAFYQQTATLRNGQAGAFGQWTAWEPISTLTREVDVVLSDGYCYRFKYIITNMANKSYEITSNDLLCCDLTPPTLDITSEELTQSTLRLAINYYDEGSGLSRINSKVNNNTPAAIASNALALELIPGPNYIKLEALDKAGNITRKILFKTYEFIKPEIQLTGIKEQGEYGHNLVFRFQSTVALSAAGVYVDDILVKQVSPGAVSLDLSAYPEGSHQIAIKGRDAQGNALEKAVGIILKYNSFNLVLLSPGEREYGSRTLPVEYWASEPVEEVWYQLGSGEKQTELILRDLPDGVHQLTLYAINARGYQSSCTVVFSVKEILPVLEVLSPVNNAVYPDKTIEMVFGTNSNVNYELGDETGVAVSGNTLTVAGDGDYTLVLTAMHPVSGNVIRNVVSFAVDSAVPEVTLHSPESRLYTYNEINISYSVNKSAYNVSQYLDGEAVDTLQNLKPGAHTFTLRITDRAGRVMEKHVNFHVASLEIASPLEGDKILSEAYPCVVPFIYTEEGWAGTLTQAMDNQTGRLITDPPGQIIPLETEPGTHALHLRGYMNEFNVARKARFQIGRKNLTSGAGSIGYTYQSLGTNGEYEVNVTLNIRNNGDLDINEPTVVRFDLIRQTGVLESYWKEVDKFPAGGNAQIPLENLTACMGDLFLVNIDPEKELVGEDPTDNYHQIEFQTGQITGITQTLPESNVYLQNVSVFNTIDVDTAGAVAYVELHTNSKVFVDNTPENGFYSIVDLGLLSPEKNYVQVFAYGDNGIVLDSRKLFFKIKSLDHGKRSYVFPWSQFASWTENRSMINSGFDRIIMSDIEGKDLVLAQSRTLRNNLLGASTIIPVINENKKVIYNIYSIENAFSNAYESINITDVPVVSGKYNLPNGKGFITIISFDPAAGTCVPLGAIPILDGGMNYINKINEKWDKLFNGINEMFEENIDLEAMLDDLVNSTIRELNNIENLDIHRFNFLNFWSFFFINYDIFQGLLGAFFVGFMNYTVDGNVSIKASDPDIIPEFRGEACVVCKEAGNIFSGYEIEAKAYFGLKANSNISVSTPGAKAGVLGLIGVNFFRFLYIPLIGVGGKFEVYRQNLDIPLNMNLDANLYYRGGVLQVVPAHTNFQTSCYHNKRLANGGAVMFLFPYFFFGAGVDVEADLKIRAIAKADLIYSTKPGFNPDLQKLVYAHGKATVDITMEYYIYINLLFTTIKIKIGSSHKEETEQGKFGKKYKDTDVLEIINAGTVN